MRTYFGRKTIRRRRLTDEGFTFVNAWSVLSGLYNDSNGLFDVRNRERHITPEIL
jgi:hypothetical protein